MVFYSTQDYLSAEARRTQMQLRGRAPPLVPGLVHPPEIERARMQTLLNAIPETQPGPNAFATHAAMTEIQRTGSSVGSRRAARRESVGEVVELPADTWMVPREENTSTRKDSLRTRLNADPRFQQELGRRRVTPPTALHPALRERSVDGPPSSPPPRDSACTNITDFMKAGMQESPELKLNATPDPASVPTFHGHIEGRTERVEHDLSGDLEEKVPVFQPTPKMPVTKDFAPRPGTPADGLQKESSGSKFPAKTPKKSIFSKLKLSTNSRTANSTSADTLASDLAAQNEEKLPVKVQAVLGESPKKTKRVSLGASPVKLPRSPSKRKNFFTRRNADHAESPRPQTTLSENQRPPNTPSTVVSDAMPQTVISDPAHWSFQERRVTSKSHSEEANDKKKDAQKNPRMTRSQSVRLSMFDGCIPPTPPAKNTPPHEKAAKEAQEIKQMHEAMKISTRKPERSREMSDDSTATKFGNYGYRDAPTLVTKPSMYSLHATVVPEMMESATMEELNARVGALDLEGLSLPAENLRRSRIASAVYSPSIYSPDWKSRVLSTTPGATPMLKVEESRASNTSSAHTKGSSSNGTIPVFYPDLVSDPSIVKSVNKDATEQVSESPLRGRTHLSPELTWHRRTHSRDHVDGDRQSFFAHHVDKYEHRKPTYNSPSTFSHTSAMPSPLQYLPATVYTPPSKGSKKRAVQTEADVVQSKPFQSNTPKSTRGSGLGIQKSSPDSSQDVFQIQPSIPANRQGTCQGIAISKPAHGDPPAGDTQKPAAPPVSDIPTDKLDVMLDMLNRLSARNGELTEMRDEMRASAARLDRRLSAVEHQRRGSPPLTPSTMGLGASVSGCEGMARALRERVPTDVAYEFYRGAMGVEVGQESRGSEVGGNGEVQQGVGSSASVGGQEGENTSDSGVEVAGEGATIRELRAQNEKLLQMVGGFAEKIKAMEEKMNRGSG